MSDGCCIDRENCWLSWEDEGGDSIPVLNFSPELIDQLGWNIDDKIYWEMIQENPPTYRLKKTEDDGSTFVPDGAEDQDCGKGLEDLF